MLLLCLFTGTRFWQHAEKLGCHLSYLFSLFFRNRPAGTLRRTIDRPADTKLITALPAHVVIILCTFRGSMCRTRTFPTRYDIRIYSTCHGFPLWCLTWIKFLSRWLPYFQLSDSIHQFKPVRPPAEPIRETESSRMGSMTILSTFQTKSIIIPRLLQVREGCAANVS